MTVAIGADHRGFALKEKLARYLKRRGLKVDDKGTFTPERVDYPDFARAVAEAVARGQARRGILICATGIGMSIAANKVRGVRAALCLNQKMARLARAHNNANVLCLGADLIKPASAQKIVRVFLKTGFSNGRHSRRVRKISGLDERLR
jgi:ribose 5-phosphate isomerase B